MTAPCSTRRRLLARSVAIGGANLLPALGRTQPTWPTRPITIIAPNAAGGPADTLARAITTSMGKALGTSVVVDNKPGASGKIGMLALLRAPRDGHTIAVTSVTAMSALPVFDPNVGYRSPGDFAPLSIAVRTPTVWCVNPALGINDLRQLVDYARAHPDKLNYASFGTNSSSHLAQEDFFRQLNIRLTHVPFKGEAEGMNALLSGQIQVQMLSGAAKPQIEAGRLKALATTTAKRWDLLPQIRTARESGLPELMNYAYEPWIGFAAANGVPQPILERLEKSVRAALQSPEAASSLKPLGYRIIASGAKEMRDAIEEDTAAYRVLLRSGRVRIE